jgi:DNA-binding MarR family transcriptional regulator
MPELILDQFLPYRLNRLAAAISHGARQVYAQDYDLTIPEWRVLATLGEFPRLTAKAIGAHSAMHKTKVSRAAKALEDRRWLARETNNDDRREEFLTLTKQGQDAYHHLVPKMLAFEQTLRASLGRDGTQAVLDAIVRLEQIFGFSSPKITAPRITPPPR